jgi:hypothetical protein
MIHAILYPLCVRPYTLTFTMLLTECKNALPDVLLDKISEFHRLNIKTNILHFQPSNAPTNMFEKKETSMDIITLFDVDYRFEYTYIGDHSTISRVSIRPCNHIQQEFIHIIFTQNDRYPYSRPGCYVDNDTYICIHKIPKKYNKTHLPFVLAQGIVYCLKMMHPISNHDSERIFKQYINSNVSEDSNEIYTAKKTYKPIPMEKLYDELLQWGSIQRFLKKNYTFSRSFKTIYKILHFFKVSRW